MLSGGPQRSASLIANCGNRQMSESGDLGQKTKEPKLEVEGKDNLLAIKPDAGRHTCGADARLCLAWHGMGATATPPPSHNSHTHRGRDCATIWSRKSSRGKNHRLTQQLGK